MEVTINWLEGVRLQASNAHGITAQLDGPPEYGGTNSGFRPMETMLVAVGSCSAFDVGQIFRKQRGELQHLAVLVRGQRSAQEPKVFTAIDLLFTIRAANISLAQARRAIDLTLEKYCSAAIMLRRAGVSISYEISWQD